MNQVAIAVVSRIGEETLLIMDKDEAVEVAVKMAGSVERFTSGLDSEDGLTFPAVADKDVTVGVAFYGGQVGLGGGHGGCALGKETQR